MSMELIIALKNQLQSAVDFYEYAGYSIVYDETTGEIVITIRKKAAPEAESKN